MSEESKTLVPLEQKIVQFYDDEIEGVVVTTTPSGQQTVYVPVSRICSHLGIDYSAQRQRIQRDPVLAGELRAVEVDSSGGPQQMQCLPLDMLNGWLFGINANRVRPDVRERLIRYQRDCYRILSAAFLHKAFWRAPDELGQIEQLGRAIIQLAREQRDFNNRLEEADERITAAHVRLTLLEEATGEGEAVSEAQASQLSQAVRAIANALSKQTGNNEYGAVYGELYRQFSITSYKLLPRHRYAEAMRFLNAWWRQVSDSDAPW